MSEQLNTKLTRFSEVVATSIYSLQGKINEIDAYATSIGTALISATSAFGSDISALGSRVTQNEKDIASLGTRVTNIESDVNDLQTESKKHLPISGGTLTGKLRFSNNISAPDISKSVNNSYLEITGGTNNTNGAFIQLYGSSKSSSPNKCVISSNNFSFIANAYSLEGTANGTLTWNGTDVTKWEGASKYIKSSAPSDSTGNQGDIWFLV